MQNNAPETPAPETIIIPADQQVHRMDLSPQEFNEQFRGWRYLLQHVNGNIIAASNESYEAMMKLLTAEHPEIRAHELMYAHGPTGIQEVFDAYNAVRNQS